MDVVAVRRLELQSQQRSLSSIPLDLRMFQRHSVGLYRNMKLEPSCLIPSVKDEISDDGDLSTRHKKRGGT